MEKDPTGKDPHEKGAKQDAGKNQLGLIYAGFCRALWMVGEVASFGANKYTRDGWEGVGDGVRRYTDAMFRHLGKEFRGEDVDKDSQLKHAAHTAWNALARLELILREERYYEQQDSKDPAPSSAKSSGTGATSPAGQGDFDFLADELRCHEADVRATIFKRQKEIARTNEAISE